MKKLLLYSVMVIFSFFISCELKEDADSDKDPTSPTEETITVTAPVSGDTLIVGGSFEIKWTSNTTKKIKIDYTTDNGAKWNNITTNLDNDGKYLWSPVPNEVSDECRIRVLTIDSALVNLSGGFFSIIKLSNKALTVASPNGGENWIGNSAQTIKWNSTEVEDVKIEYTLNNGVSWTTITEATPSDGFFSWERVPNSPSNNARIRITDIDSGIRDESDGVFSIEPEYIITVVSPNGGEEWITGSSQYIRWTTDVPVPPAAAISGNDNDAASASASAKKKKLTNKTELSSAASKLNSSKGNKVSGSPKETKSIFNVKIEFSSNNGASWSVVSESVPNNGIYLWGSVPALQENQSNLCLIRISDADDGVPFDISDGSFRIFSDAPKEITIVSPNGGEKWSAGTSEQIKWNSVNVSNVKIEYTIDNGQNWLTIVSSTPSNGVYNWAQIPETVSNNCRVKISDASDISTFAISASTFEITSEPNIQLLSPNGEENYNVSDLIKITWKAEKVAFIKIELTTNGGATWRTISDAAPNNGLFNWNIDDPNINSTLCKIKISDASDGDPNDESDDYFTITNQVVKSIQLIEPVGGETYYAGQSVQISWASANVSIVKIEFSSNNGVNWQTIVSNLSDNGGYQWTAPEIDSKVCLIKITDADDISVQSKSSSVFSVRPVAELTVSSPNGGENWEAGVPDTIKWNSKGVDEVKIEYSTDNGSTWQAVINKTSNKGFFVTSFSVPSNNYKIAVSSAVESNSPRDESDGVFIVSPQTRILVQSPNGGEIWESGSSYYIRWATFQGSKAFINPELNQNSLLPEGIAGVQAVKIEYTTNGGADWNLITGSTLNTGIYSWQNIPIHNSLNCLIKISDADDGIPTDISDNVFTITNNEPQSVNVVSPNGGEAWQIGTTQEIKWNSENISEVKIELTTNNGVSWSAIASSVSSSGFYLWDIPVNINEAENCRIRISDAIDGMPFDVSDNFFSLAPEPSITVIEPDGGESLISGTPYSIRWNSVNVESVKIEYTTNGGASWNLLTASTASTGNYVWQNLPDLYSEQCKIKISDAATGVPFDVSNSNFTITNQSTQTITVISPNGGEVWNAGTTEEIKWTAFGVQNVKIEFTTNNGSNWTTIVASTPSTGYYSWTQIPAVTSTNCRIRISDAADSAPSDESDDLFSIAPEPGIKVTSPNGGESYFSSTSTSITWTSENVADVKIEYTTNGGATWNTISASAPSNGFYLWENIPDLNSALCQVKISDASDGTPFDISDGYFIITNQINQTLTLTSPNGGEQWEAGTTQNITWQSTGIAQLKIEFTTNNGSSWNLIVDNYNNSGAYEWSIPLNLNSPQAKVRVTDADDNIPSDESNASFTIKPAQSITVLTPVGGEVYQAGEPITITWTATGIENVGIKYTTTNGLGSFTEPNFYVVTASTPNNGSYVTSFSIPSNEYYVEVYDAADEAPKSRSIGNFTILPQTTNSIRVISPNGGENLLVGELHEIQWVSTGIEDVKLEYSLNGGSTWTTIINSTPSSGTYNWIVPVVAFRSDNCKIRITDVNSVAFFDESNSAFSIIPTQPYVRVIAPNGGEEWNYNVGQTIIWESAGIEKVDIYFTYNNGFTWEVVIQGFPSYGAYEWDPPNYSTSLARVKITEAGNAGVSDISDSFFSLINTTVEPVPFIIFTSPMKDYEWQVNSTHDICWSNSHEIAQVNIDYSLDNGVTWTNIATNYSAIPWNYENCVSWILPNLTSNAARIRIQGFDAAGLPVLEELSQVFKIVP